MAASDGRVEAENYFRLSDDGAQKQEIAAAGGEWSSGCPQIRCCCLPGRGGGDGGNGDGSISTTTTTTTTGTSSASTSTSKHLHTSSKQQAASSRCLNMARTRRVPTD